MLYSIVSLLFIVGSCIVAWLTYDSTLPVAMKSLLGLGASGGLAIFLPLMFKNVKAVVEHPITLELTSYLKLPDYSKHLGMIPVMRKHLRTLCDVRGVNTSGKGKSKRRLILYVDDLDRCLPNKAVEVLEAIKVFLDTEGFVFVLALDKEVIVNAVEAHYGKEYPISGGDYIKKLIQVEFALQALRSEDIKEFVTVLQQELTRLDND
ncbi:MAG: hypothetical protein IID42_04870, partial [Planctomycetes bacterium]|nr:hypothetical protein [Planctomycetota bacterium]